MEHITYCRVVNSTRPSRRIGSAALVADGLHAAPAASQARRPGRGGRCRAQLAASRSGHRPAHHGCDARRALAVRQVGASLKDAVDLALADRATVAVSSVTGIDRDRELRIRWIGHALRAEVDTTVNHSLTVVEAHDLAHHAEQPRLAEVRRA